MVGDRQGRKDGDLGYASAEFREPVESGGTAVNAESSNENARHRGVPDELEELRLYRERQRQDLAEEWEGRGGAGGGVAGQHRGGRRVRESGGGGRSAGGRGVERAAGMLGSRWFGWLLVG